MSTVLCISIKLYILFIYIVTTSFMYIVCKFKLFPNVLIDASGNLSNYDLIMFILFQLYSGYFKIYFLFLFYSTTNNKNMLKIFALG